MAFKLVDPFAKSHHKVCNKVFFKFSCKVAKFVILFLKHGALKIKFFHKVNIMDCDYSTLNGQNGETNWQMYCNMQYVKKNFDIQRFMGY